MSSEREQTMGVIGVNLITAFINYYNYPEMTPLLAVRLPRPFIRKRSLFELIINRLEVRV